MRNPGESQGEVKHKCMATLTWTFFIYYNAYRLKFIIIFISKVDNSVEENLSTEDATENILKRDEAIEAVLSSTKKTHTIKSKGNDSPTFYVGMKVWGLNVRSQQKKRGKLDPNYLAHYTIIGITGKSLVYRIARVW